MYERELDIHRMMAEGLSKKQICTEMAKKWRVSERTIERQYYTIVDAMTKMVEHGRAELRTKLMARNDEIYKRSMQEGKYKTALDANLAQAKFGGLNDNGKDEASMPSIIEVEQQDFSSGLSLAKAENED